MVNRAHFHYDAPIFHGLQRPEKGIIVGYAAIIDKLGLKIPVQRPLALICNRNKSFENEDWRVFQQSYLPEEHEE